ncbi:hypothetical protein QE152_g22791 [Popillia japonica]|uniref:Retrotransposon gag domain-containing protein n=1 Tax=Popillia japonica TaxID=7064 RepID=A0AAW1KHF6_POPJA
MFKLQEIESRKVAICLNLIGEKGQAIFTTFKKDRNKLKLTELLGLFKSYCDPKKNCIYEIFKFYSCKQKLNRPIEEYITELKLMASTCKFSEEDMIRDRLVVGTSNEIFKESRGYSKNNCSQQRTNGSYEQHRSQGGGYK